MKKHWPTIKHLFSFGYSMLLWVAIVANAYTDRLLPTCVFTFLLTLNVLEVGIDKIAEAIRTQRNYHIIGDANEINLSGSSLYADNVSVRDRMTREGARQ
ncbi:MAG: hypothetical protein AUJ49_04860 [Desulfovibrionaceae bacterium CG1_02_65_16]|nr:MAG: hypothetical protein AUJ49_04860 [Desulfovibrionaceae bacterium CG1_02_65_16]